MQFTQGQVVKELSFKKCRIVISALPGRLPIEILQKETRNRFGGRFGHGQYFSDPKLAPISGKVGRKILNPGTKINFCHILEPISQDHVKRYLNNSLYAEKERWILKNHFVKIYAYIENIEVASARFKRWPADEGEIIASDLWACNQVNVDENLRGQGLATAMYSYISAQGYHIGPSSNLLPSGKRLWERLDPGIELGYESTLIKWDESLYLPYQRELSEVIQDILLYSKKEETLEEKLKDWCRQKKGTPPEINIDLLDDIAKNLFPDDSINSSRANTIKFLIGRILDSWKPEIPTIAYWKIVLRSFIPNLLGFKSFGDEIKQKFQILENDLKVKFSDDDNKFIRCENCLCKNKSKL